MRALDRKLLRDALRLKGQVLAIALVIAAGVATTVMSLGTSESLGRTRDAYYERYRFAHVFASLERAPRPLAERIAAIPGVARVQTRIARFVTLDVAGVEEPVRGLIVSLPDDNDNDLNAVVLGQGRMIRPGANDEVIVHEAFAEAHGFVPGDEIRANLNGKLRRLTIVGIGLSPEFVYALGPGDIVPDDRRYGVFWLSRAALEAAFDLEGSFNDVALRLMRGASEAAVKQRLDALLDPYGGTGAYGREDHVSNAFIQSELEQQATITHILPPIFLFVAAFLVNMVMSRMIQTQREMIGLLRALGYTALAIGRHYGAFALGVGALGVSAGCILGVGIARDLVDMYGRYYRFPLLYFHVAPMVFIAAGVAGLGAAGIGAFFAVRRAMALAPAVALAAPVPTAYRRGSLESFIDTAFLGPLARMAARHVTRWPLRSASMTLGIAFATGLLVSTLFFLDSIDHMIDHTFFRTWRQDVSIQLADAREDAVIHAFQRLPGVQRVELHRTVAVRLIHGPRVERVAIVGVDAGSELFSLVDNAGRSVGLAPRGLVLSGSLARLLDVRLGDPVIVEVLEGRRVRKEVPVRQLIDELLGTTAYMDRTALNDLLGEGAVTDNVLILADTTMSSAFFRALKEVPNLAGATMKAASLDVWRAMIDTNIRHMILFYVGLAGTIAVGVVFNGVKVTISERRREIATLRVMGYRLGDVAMIIVGEVALITVCALPLGALIGSGLARLFVAFFDTDLYRLPFVIEPATYGYAIILVLVACATSTVVAMREVARLDLADALKTRD